MTIWDVKDVNQLALLYLDQTGRPDLVAMDNDVYITFVTDGTGRDAGYHFKYMCDAFNPSGRKRSYGYNGDVVPSIFQPSC